MEWQSWPSLSLNQREKLPEQPGIYVVVDTDDQVWYVGKAVNLNARWYSKSHHRYRQLSRTNNKRGYRLHWQIFTIAELSDKEQQYIDLFKPHLNYTRVRKYAKKAIQPHQEISRLLKVINRKTLLFPNIRSLVLGYYTEIIENEETSLLDEYVVISIAVGINDHDGPIMNSCQKSLSKKGISIKGCWKYYESDDIETTSGKPVVIPIFILENVVYQFLCCPNLLMKLENCLCELENIEIAQQSVLALKDLSILPELVVNNGRFTLASEDYLRFRMPDLNPIQDLLN